MPSSSRNSRSAASFSGSGASWTRYMQGWRRRFQLLGRGDIGEDHELLDQPVAVEPRARLDRARRGPSASSRTRSLAAGRARARRARARARSSAAIGAVERPQRRSRAAAASVARRAVMRRLRPPRRSAAPPSASGRARSGGGACGRAASIQRCDGEAGAVDRRASASTARSTAPRAASARRGRGNRPNCRARSRLAVERAARAARTRRRRRSRRRVPAAGIGRVGIGLGPHRVVEIARVGCRRS